MSTPNSTTPSTEGPKATTAKASRRFSRKVQKQRQQQARDKAAAAKVQAKAAAESEKAAAAQAAQAEREAKQAARATKRAEAAQAVQAERDAKRAAREGKKAEAEAWASRKETNAVRKAAGEALLRRMRTGILGEIWRIARPGAAHYSLRYTFHDYLLPGVLDRFSEDGKAWHERLEPLLLTDLEKEKLCDLWFSGRTLKEDPNFTAEERVAFHTQRVYGDYEGFEYEARASWLLNYGDDQLVCSNKFSWPIYKKAARQLCMQYLERFGGHIVPIQFVYVLAYEEAAREGMTEYEFFASFLRHPVPIDMILNRKSYRHAKTDLFMYRIWADRQVRDIIDATMKEEWDQSFKDYSAARFAKACAEPWRDAVMSVGWSLRNPPERTIREDYELVMKEAAEREKQELIEAMRDAEETYESVQDRNKGLRVHIKKMKEARGQGQFDYRDTPTGAQVREMFHYDPLTGMFTWKKARHKSRIGKPAGGNTCKLAHDSSNKLSPYGTRVARIDFTNSDGEKRQIRMCVARLIHLWIWDQLPEASVHISEDPRYWEGEDDGGVCEGLKIHNLFVVLNSNPLETRCFTEPPPEDPFEALAKVQRSTSITPNEDDDQEMDPGASSVVDQPDEERRHASSTEGPPSPYGWLI